MNTVGSTIDPTCLDEAGVTAAMRPSRAELDRARRRLHRKASLVAIVVGTSYAVLVFGQQMVVVTVLAAGLLAFGLTAAATSVFHDGNHGSFSTSPVVNRFAAYTGDLMGASSWIWRFKHNNLHHGNTNVDGVDMDIAQAPFARLTPHQSWRPWHRYQHLYMWVLYGFLTLQWFLISDVMDLVHRGVGGRRFPRQPRPRDYASIAVGKALHLSWAVLIPMLFHAWWMVLVVYISVSWTVGLMLATMFQLAHCTSLVEFPDDTEPRRGAAFVQHQLRTTADIGGGSNSARRRAHWLMGGLDFQVEHHLAPRLPHTVYPLVAPRVAAACSAGPDPVRQHATLVAAIQSHGRWLREMGRRPAEPMGVSRGSARRTRRASVGGR
jgi:linoleoyl-CoA desaturase